MVDALRQKRTLANGFGHLDLNQNKVGSEFGPHGHAPNVTNAVVRPYLNSTVTGLLDVNI